MSDTNKNYILLSGVNEAGEKQEIVMSIECDIHLIRRNRLGIRAKARIAYGGITIADILIYENRGTIKIEFPTRTETIKGIDNFECQVNYNANNTFSNTNTVTFSKGQHDYSIKSETKAECEKEGKIIYECKLCHENKTEKIEALKHNYIITVVQPKCNSYGYTIHICSLCGKTYKDNYVEKAEHSYSLAKSETVPIDDYKYESKTIDRYDCEICGNSYTESHMNEHNYIERDIAPTCTERGYKLHKCKCGKEYRTDYIAATGHNYKAIEKVRPSYLSAGYIIYKCTACGNTVTKTIPTLLTAFR